MYFIAAISFDRVRVRVMVSFVQLLWVLFLDLILCDSIRSRSYKN